VFGGAIRRTKPGKMATSAAMRKREPGSASLQT